MRCIRCKARKSVINSLEQAITDRIGEKAVLQNTVDNLNSEIQVVKETLISTQQELFEVQQKWKDEVEKLNAKSEPEACTMCTQKNNKPPLLQQVVAKYPQNADHSKCEKQIVSLQWVVSSKTAELVRLHNQLQEVKREKKDSSEDLNFYRNRSERLKIAMNELTEAHTHLQAQLAQCRTQLSESEQSRETLRVLLTNLATGVSSMFS